jgi:hypothetical protein
MRLVARAILSIGLSLSAIQAANIVGNSSFETPGFASPGPGASSFPPWISLGWFNFAPFAHSGDFVAASFCPVPQCISPAFEILGSVNWFYQDLPTTVSQTYLYSFWSWVGSPENQLQAYAGGNLVINIVNAPGDRTYRQYSTTFVANSTVTRIAFTGFGSPLVVDDVSVEAVPEPTVGLLGGALMGLAVLFRRRPPASLDVHENRKCSSHAQECQTLSEK